MRPIRVAFIWHMHQPWYLRPGTREATLPFARLHACGAYYDMPWLLGQFEQTTVTFNLVPSLTEQIMRYARGESTDRALELSRRDPADLEPDDKCYLLTRFCTGHPSSAVEASPRYAQLLRRRGIGRDAEQIERVCRELSDPDFRDLQVWANLAWCGYAMRAESEVMRELATKDRGFTEREKLALLDEMHEAMGRVLPLYRRLWEGGKAELTTSPYYHPILPLLCDMRDAQRCMNRAKLPRMLWREPEEAQRQLERARQAHQEMFGAPPEGLWPSEGSVSDAALAEVERAGFSWAASDEQVLAYSLDPHAGERPGPQALYRPYRVGDGQLSIVFRNHQLSDLIGFVYRDWSAQDAAQDMMARLRRIAEARPTGGTKRREPPLVCVILDGENPWGWYSDRGEGFLRALYAALEADPAIETTTVTEYLSRFPARERLESVFPGSWIEHSFSTWIGGEQHRRAWEMLTNALAATRRPALRPRPSGGMDRAREQLLIAEGSDWFWWYSDQHSTPDADLFDALFRANVAEVYRALGEEEPAAVGVPIAQMTRCRFDREVAGLMQAQIDGRVTSYFEWQPAALLRTSGLGSAMRRSDFVIVETYIGYDLENLWLRVDTACTAEVGLRGHELHFVFDHDRERRLILRWPEDEEEAQPEAAGELALAAEVAVGRVIEASISLEALDAQPGSVLHLAVQVLHKGRSMERWPEIGFLELEYRGEEAAADTWFV